MSECHHPLVQITAEQVSQYLDLGQLINVIEYAFGNFSKVPDNGVVQPVRSVLTIKEPAGNPSQPGFFGLMPVYSEHDGVLACKLVSFYPGNAESGRHTHMSQIMLYDPAYGNLLAMMDGDVVTAFRTAAASAVASKHLYSGGVEQPVTLAIIGAGVQARSHVKAFREVFNIAAIRVWSRTMESAMRCAEEVGGEACLTTEEAVTNADIIITVSFARTPIVKKAWVKPGAHINAVGACRHDWQEIDPELMRSAVVYVDSREAANKEAGDIILAKAEIYAEIGEVINGSKPAKTTPYTVFKSLGMGLEDAVSAKLVYDSYKARNSAESKL